MRGAYSSDVEGGDPVAVRFAISGRFDVLNYLSFIVERAKWLDLSGWVAADDERSITLVVAGPEALVGSLEMAATLGPLNALVEAVEVQDELAPVAVGFQLRYWHTAQK